jgi:hypothetical protein
MNKLEQYLHQVCRSMGGPRSLREHVRQELREHLLDAVARHQSEGLSAEAALDKALEEFGQPETVRSDIEATHGHSSLAVVLDKAMQWKEKTMKAKWLWSTWTFLAVVGILILELFSCFFLMIYIVPKMKKLRSDGIFTSYLETQTQSLFDWMFDFINGVADVFDKFNWLILLIILALWGLFEWRVKSENKSFIRLSMLGSVAFALAIVVALMTGAMVVSFAVTMPTVSRMAKSYSVDQITVADAMMSAIEESAKKGQWENALKEFETASKAIRNLGISPSLQALTKLHEQPTLTELEQHWQATLAALPQVHLALITKDQDRLLKAMKDLKEAIEPLNKAAERALLEKPGVSRGL